MNARINAIHVVGLAGSLMLHGGLVALLGLVPVAKRVGVGPTTVEFEVPPAPPAAPPPPVEKVVEKEEEQVAPTAPAPLQESEPEPEPEPEATPLDDAPVDLTGVTLTSDGPGPGWSTVTGNGSAMRGPIQRPRAAKSLTPAEGRGSTRTASVQRRVAPAPNLVPLASLAKRPVPPALDGVLAANYPADARRRGEAGQAVVSARIEADGVVRSASVASESGPGFGEACRRTVLGSTWSPPRDEGGRAVATQISYTCRFRVDR